MAVGSERAVAKVIDGVLIWEPGESQAGQYIVVTKGFWLNALKLEEEVRLLKLRIEQLEAKGTSNDWTNNAILHAGGKDPAVH